MKGLKVDEKVYQDLKKIFDENELITKVPIQELPFWESIKYQIFLNWMSMRVKRINRKVEKLKKKFLKQEMTYTIYTWKYLFADKLEKELKKILSEREK